MPGPTPPKQVRMIERLSKQGHTHVAIAEATGLHRATVGRHLARVEVAKAEAVEATANSEVLQALAGLVRGATCAACQHKVLTLASCAVVRCDRCGHVWDAPRPKRAR